MLESVQAVLVVSQAALYQLGLPSTWPAQPVQQGFFFFILFWTSKAWLVPVLVCFSEPTASFLP